MQSPSTGTVASMEELGSAHSRSEGGSDPSIARRRGLTAVRTEAGKVLDKRMTFIVNGQSIKKICKISPVLMQSLMEQEECTFEWHCLSSCYCNINNWPSISAGPFRIAPGRRDSTVWRDPSYPNGRKSRIVSCHVQYINTTFKSPPELFSSTFLVPTSQLCLGLFCLCIHICFT